MPVINNSTTQPETESGSTITKNQKSKSSTSEQISNNDDTISTKTTTTAGHSNVKGIVTAALVVVSVLLFLFILYMIWRVIKRSQKRRKRRQEEEIESQSGHLENQQQRTNLTPIIINSDDDRWSQKKSITISPTTYSKSSVPSTPTLVDGSPILSSIPLKSSFTSSSNTSLKTQRYPIIHSRPSGLSLNTSISMLTTTSEQHDSNSTPINSPNYDENAYRLSRALQSSPVVSALLSESFDTQAVRRKRKHKKEAKEEQEVAESTNDESKEKQNKEKKKKSEEKDERSFDWEQCKFNEVEEEAMWLPELDQAHQQQVGHSRSFSEPNQTVDHLKDLSNPYAPVRNSMYEHEYPINSTSTLVKSEEGEDFTIRQDDSQSQLEHLTPLSSSPFHQSVSKPRPAIFINPRIRKPPQTAPEFLSQSESFVVVSRKRPASAGVTATRFDHANLSHSRSNSSITPDSECSTESLRRAGALAIRKNSGGQSSLHSIRSTRTTITTNTTTKKLKPLDIYPPRSKSSSVKTWATKASPKTFLNNQKNDKLSSSNNNVFELSPTKATTATTTTD